MKVLVTGVAGDLGTLVAKHLQAGGHEVIGLDRRQWHNQPKDIEFHRIDVRKRAAADVFRRVRPEAAVHMATVTHLKHHSDDRYRINLVGTRAVFDYSSNYGVKQTVFVGRHTYYGAAPDTALYHREPDPPMAVNTFPELADLVAADLYAGSALWVHPDLTTTVLRFCYTLGPTCSGTLASFLRGPYVPTVLGYDPLFQFLHDEDVAAAIAATLEHRLRGVFNVAGPSPVPLSVLIQQTGRTAIPIPELLFRLSLGRFGLPRLPRGAVEHVKYPVVIDDGRFREATGFRYKHDEDACIAAFRDASRSLAH